MPTCSSSESTCSNTTARDDDCNRDPPELSNEISDFVSVTPVEFEPYYDSERNFTSYVSTTDQL